ncbi:putative acyl-CoA carboxylase beta chain [Gordonia hirsuta DSM 44140 = NBRC 16056]|uniref:Putative acyl-CoA carboxylase beta chain n=1 Tax=Gordonia hirsuta DSM 44140 = NBRC 16056 TaxID=1121927 RepID=L7LBH1_9ACTN|nr:carboxyl transferase domain-containing protein [Gordonia hirsuta]GAC58279.1 putative acyl-CoA carboxylase beta chain [Gordonia hirsuta DSM 44140 = NBRC 16056]
MPVLQTAIDPASEEFTARRAEYLERISEIDAEHAKAVAAGGPRYVQRHRERGKLLARERIEMLLDPAAPFMELSPLAAWGTDFHVGGSLVTGIGVVEGVECAILAHEPTVKGGTGNPYSVRKFLRLFDIAKENNLPLICLVESGGADLPTQSEIFVPGGRQFRDLTEASASGRPVISLVFGNSTAGGAYVPGMSDYTVMVKEGAKVFLAGPPLVKMATGEVSDDESLGGAEMHARTSGLADYLAVDEMDAIRIGRQIVSRLNWRKAGPEPSLPADPPVHPIQDLPGIVPVDIKQPFDPLEVIGRLVDGSRFDEFKPLYGTSLVTGWASIQGYPVGILANARGILFSEESQKAAQFIQLANQIDVPLVFLQNVTGFMVGKEYEQNGIIKHGAMMINAVSNSRVPHLTINMGASYGAGNYGMCGRAYGPRFLFSWPNSKTAVMGGQQLAGVMSIVARQAAAARGVEFDEAADTALREKIETQIDTESIAPFMSGKVYDDGIIDPRDTRTILGYCLSIVSNQSIEGVKNAFGVFRM